VIATRPKLSNRSRNVVRSARVTRDANDNRGDRDDDTSLTATLSSGLTSAEVPQADDLDKVRAVVVVATRGPMTTGDIAAETGYSVRHVEYRLRAAQLLGLLDKQKDGFALSARGRTLLDTRPTSERERVTWRHIVEESPLLSALAPDLFATVAPTRDQLADRMLDATAISRSTALRRAGALLSWRRRLQSRQLELFPELG
jgi:hypothetical protein